MAFFKIPESLSGDDITLTTHIPIRLSGLIGARTPDKGDQVSNILMQNLQLTALNLCQEKFSNSRDAGVRVAEKQMTLMCLRLTKTTGQKLLRM